MIIPGQVKGLRLGAHIQIYRADPETDNALMACGGRGYMSYGPLNINCDQCFGTGLRESSPQHA